MHGQKNIKLFIESSLFDFCQANLRLLSPYFRSMLRCELCEPRWRTLTGQHHTLAAMITANFSGSNCLLNTLTVLRMVTEGTEECRWAQKRGE